jgi:hypothetical protein
MVRFGLLIMNNVTAWIRNKLFQIHNNVSIPYNTTLQRTSTYTVKIANLLKQSGFLICICIILSCRFQVYKL